MPNASRAVTVSGCATPATPPCSCVTDSDTGAAEVTTIPVCVPVALPPQSRTVSDCEPAVRIVTPNVWVPPSAAVNVYAAGSPACTSELPNTAVPVYTVERLPKASKAVTVKNWVIPAVVAGTGVISNRAAQPGVTMTDSEPEASRPSTSAAVSDWAPSVIGVTLIVPTPLTRVASAPTTVAGSELTSRAVPV